MNESAIGNVFIVAAPSGGGKTSLVKALIHNLDNIEVSISHTTRPMRSGETANVDYFFISEEQFMAMLQAQAFIEHAQVFDYYYGTSIVQIHDRLKAGIDVVLDIDWQGAQQIKRIFPKAVSIFILPPSIEALRNRLQQRKRDADDIIDKRMEQARNEMSHYAEFDYIIINDDFSQAAQSLKIIVEANRFILDRQSVKMKKLLSVLLEKA